MLAGGAAEETEHDGAKALRGSAEMVTSRSPVGSLAISRHASLVALLTADHMIEALLDSLFGSAWSDFEVYQSVLDVYDAIDSEAARDALERAGFTAFCHPHSKARFRSCSCRSEARR